MAVQAGLPVDVRVNLLTRQIAAHQREYQNLLRKRTKATRAAQRVGHKPWTKDQERKLHQLPAAIQRKQSEIKRITAKN